MVVRRSARLSTASIGNQTAGLGRDSRPTGDQHENLDGHGAKRKRSLSATNNVEAQGRRRAKGRTQVNGAGVSTPRRAESSRKTDAPPITPTPAAVRLMTAKYSSGDIDDSTPPPPANRPADPHRTNAPLVSPETSRVLAHSEILSPSKPGAAPLTTHTNDILREACAHLVKAEPRMKALIDKHHCHVFSPDGLAEEIDPFRSLTSGIIAQQVSGAAAKAIKNRFIALFQDADSQDEAGRSQAFPTPSQVAHCDLARLRSAGLSARKAEYIQGLAEKFASGELSAEMLFKATDEEVLEKLTAVRGLGRWSVEMFACFGLKRLDVFSTGDLGVQRGLAAFVGRDVSKLKAKGGGKWKYMCEKDMLDHAAKFAPYRSLFMWYMWRAENVNVDAVQNQ